MAAGTASRLNVLGGCAGCGSVCRCRVHNHASDGIFRPALPIDLKMEHGSDDGGISGRPNYKLRLSTRPDEKIKIETGGRGFGWMHTRMSLNFDFSDDVEFSRLVARQRDVDVTLVALELARDAYPQLDFNHTLSWIAKRGRELIHPATRCQSERELLRELTRCLAGTHGLHGDRDAFLRPESSYLHRVIETGVGIPISLSLVYTAVAQQAGIDLVGVAAPMHFLARYDGAGGTLFLDAFHQGRLMTYDRCVAWLQHLTNLSRDEIEPMLEPAEPREIAVRMLNNLKALHVQREAWEDAWKVQCRLTALHPAAFDQRRDLALIALKSNRPGVAIDLLERCLRDCPSEQDRSVLVQHLRAAEQLLAAWN